MENVINEIETLPLFLQVKDLVDLGLYPSENAVYLARRRGDVPDYITFGRRTVFPRESVIEFLQTGFKKGNIPSKSENPNCCDPQDNWQPSTTPCNHQDQFLDMPPTQDQRQAEHLAILDVSEAEYQAMFASDCEVDVSV